MSLFLYDAAMESSQCSKPTLYYDGACPVCAREVAMYRRQTGADGVRWVDVARCETSDLGPGLTRDAAMARIHLRRPDGVLVSGAAAFTELWQSLPRWSLLGRLFGSAATLWLLEAGYRAFLAVRPLWRRGGASR
jgi:predicted DCC family thiol-disulfide oxidoreductase YuxK